MSKQIEGVPESITRQQYIDLIGSVGFVADDLYELRFGLDEITAVVKAYNADGKQYVVDDEISKHYVSIPVLPLDDGMSHMQQQMDLDRLTAEANRHADEIMRLLVHPDTSLSEILHKAMDWVAVQEDIDRMLRQRDQLDKDYPA